MGRSKTHGEVLRFTKDKEFSEPKRRRRRRARRWANGLTAWKTEDGTTLKELDERV
jgi:hypothetical protein